MVVNAKQLVSLPVQTQGGVSVGKVTSFEFETDTGRLTSLRVKARGLMPGLLDQELSVAWDQIVEITSAKVVVKDNVIPVGSRLLATRPSPNA